MRVLVLSSLLLAGAALFDQPAWAAEKRPVVCVAAFDNQTSEPAYDVLRKGLAEMVLTDLVASNQVDVVERERLDAVVAEQRLQRKGGFDTATVVRLGKLVGASHAVVGSFQLEGTTLRLEVRVVEVVGGKVTAAAKVTGPRDSLFSLQEQLVARLLTDLSLKTGKVTVTSVGTADTLLDYSKALDAYDRGDFTQAASQISEVLQRAPQFELGQDFRLSVMKRLAAAGDARASGRTQQRLALQHRAVGVLGSARRALVSMGDLEASRHLTYRVIHAQCLGLALDELLTPGEVRNIPLGAEAQVDALVTAQRDDLVALGQELAAWKGSWKWFPEQPDVATLTALELKPPGDLLLLNSPGITQRYEGELVLLGRVTLSAAPFLVRPSPAERTPALVEVGAQLLIDAAALEARAPAAHGPMELTVACLDARAQGLAQVGRTQAAVTAWQDLLERYPQSTSFKRVEAQVKAVIAPGAEQLSQAEEDRALAKAAPSCDRERLARVAAPVLARKDRQAGLWGVWPVLDGLARQCGEALSPWLDEQRVGFAAAHHDCERARATRLSPERLRELAPSCVK
jgi:TolB-like protein